MKTRSQEKFSLLIMAWNRWTNLQRIIRAAQDYSEVDEIIIFNNNNKVHFRAACSSNLKIVNSNHHFGLRARWILGALAKNDFLVMQDDDLILPSPLFCTFRNLLHKDPDRIYSLHGRKSAPDNSYDFRDVYGEVEMVLTRAAAMHKKAIAMVLEAERLFFQEKERFPSAREFPADDIFLSHCLTCNFGKRHIAFKHPYEELEDACGLSSLRNHTHLRTVHMRRCQEFFRNYQRHLTVQSTGVPGLGNH